MKNDFALSAKNITKLYKLYDAPSDRVKEVLHPFKKKYHKIFTAVKNLTFDIHKGTSLGIIGKNGSGKSTLLQILCGILVPSSGTIETKGKISALLELGSGFNPEFTGRQNVYLNASILGLSDHEIDQRFDEILAFSEIGDFIDQPVKTYSSGMYVRLAFSVAVNVNSEILVIDEALAVGDIRFQQKCLRKMNEFKNSGTVILVSHDLSSIRNFCDRVFWMQDGQLLHDGSPEEITKKYETFMYYGHTAATQKSAQSVKKTRTEVIDIDWQDLANYECFGDGRAKITKAALCSESTGERLTILSDEQWVYLYMEIECFGDVDFPIIGFIIFDKHGNHIMGTNTHIANKHLVAFSAGRHYTVRFDFKMPCLKNGKYTLSPAVASGTQENHVVVDWIHDAWLIEASSPSPAASQSWVYPIQEIKFDIIGQEQL